MKRFGFTILLSSLISATSQANTVYGESASGDLSGDYARPTVVLFDAGRNTIRAQLGNTGNGAATNGQDADYLTFDLEPQP
jgi:hypothetical protein